ncbi:MAG: YlbF family regulator [Erysipelotrichia bacterium]|jgi:cell fate (sporulation/competence/biofilm development) regulator YmcA (YheA/YmcA/DUF963 family)|nr:YlbF family regulator [Erysipelotrichia bacterium]
MTDLQKSLLTLKEEINNNDLVKEYFRIRNLVEKNEEINSLKKKINDAQVKLSLSMGEQENHSANKKVYEQLVIKYESHPLIANFLSLQIELRVFLQNIADLLE